MRAIISPYFEAQGPLQMLYRGYFVSHYDVAKRGQQIHLGLIDAGCSTEVASLPEGGESSLHESILSIHDAQYIDYLQSAWANWSNMPNSSAEIFPNISPNRHINQFNQHPVALAGWYIGDAAALIGEHTWRNALGSASAVIEAAARLKSGELAVYAFEIAYLESLNTAGNKVLEFGAEALIVATGFDTFNSDPLGCFELESCSYYAIGRMIRSLKLPTLFAQEGGYFVPALRENVRQMVVGFES
ncbi:MAG: hypothetical protein HC941_14345 [Microcoleus sp. SU_5_3]|nr:hypothetical protein [Microcoleus sp. SU_5_3]